MFINYSYIPCHPNQHNLMGVYDLPNCIRIIGTYHVPTHILYNQ